MLLAHDNLSGTPILFNDAIYHVKLTIPDTNNNLKLNFTSLLTGTKTDMSWGLDNVHIHANP